MLHITDLSKRFDATPVFDRVTLSVARGEFVALLGESGVGKSTLLNCIAGLEAADHGTVRIADVDLATLDENGRARLRRERLGFVFQAFHVLPHLSVAENVALPLLLVGRTRSAALARAEQLLQAVGLPGLGGRWPAQLSGGQLQRVAIARAVAHSPGLILADEPTGNLDPATAERVLALLREEVQATGAACLLVTHSAAAAARADRVLRLLPHGVEVAGPLGSAASGPQAPGRTASGTAAPSSVAQAAD
jgi:putative ABC transport system ATP-binding protein